MTFSQKKVSALRAIADAANPERRAPKANGNSKKPEPWKPTVTRGNALMVKTMPEISFLCSPWIPEGVMLLAGRPKLGKTSIARQWSASVTNGWSLWGKPCSRHAVLVLSLEEGEKLMRRKLVAARYTPQELADVHLAFNWRQGILGVGDLQQYLEAEPAVRLVIIDSLTRFRDPPTREKQAFQQDYEAVSQLAELAKAIPGLSIVVVHHTTKSTNGDDPIAEISGTYGLSAAADSYAVLRKQGGDFVLHFGGRYWDEAVDAYTLVRDAGRWQMAGAHDPVQLSPMQRAYLARLAADGLVTTQGMATRFGVKKNTASEVLGELSDKGMAERVVDGWQVTETGRAKALLYNTTNTPNDTNVQNSTNYPNYPNGSEGSEVRKGVVQ